MAIVSRLVATIIAGYWCSSAVVSLVAVVAPLIAGIPRYDASWLSHMVGVLLYPTLLLWGFSEQRLARVWTVICGTALMSHGLLWWLTPRLLRAVEGA